MKHHNAPSLYAPKAQQIQGLTCVLARVALSTFHQALSRLVAENYISKSHRHSLLKLARHLKGNK